MVDDWSFNVSVIKGRRSFIQNRAAKFNPASQFISVPIIDFNWFINDIQALGYETVCAVNKPCYYDTSCQNVETQVPDLVIQLHDKNYKIPGDQLIQSRIDEITQKEVC